MEGEPSDRVCKITDAPASLESDGRKHFPASRNENRGKGDGEAKNNKQTELDNNRKTLTALYVHI